MTEQTPKPEQTPKQTPVSPRDEQTARDVNACLTAWSEAEANARLRGADATDVLRDVPE